MQKTFRIGRALHLLCMCAASARAAPIVASEFVLQGTSLFVCFCLKQQQQKITEPTTNQKQKTHTKSQLLSSC